MTRQKRTYASERRRLLGATALDQRAVPVSEVTPAKLVRDPKLTVELSPQELKDARKKAQKASESAQSTS
jgi:hypothetical protein